MKANWGLLLLPSLLLFLLLLIVPQFVFLRTSFFRDLGVGQFEPGFRLDNYVEVFTDRFYLRSLLLNFYVSFCAVALSLLCAFPVAYILARMRSRWATIILALIVVSSLISVTIKVLGLMIIFGADGPFNRLALGLGLVSERLKLVGTEIGVIIGLTHYVLGFLILLLYSVIRTIPRSLEEAARIHGASRLRVFWRIVIPLSLPGVANGALIVFNLCMGAFVSAAILGGGKVLTLPVIIERTIVLETQYALGAALSGVLLATVLLINVAADRGLRRSQVVRGVRV